jgi:hypothetical protein
MLRPSPPNAVYLLSKRCVTASERLPFSGYIWLADTDEAAWFKGPRMKESAESTHAIEQSEQAILEKKDAIAYLQL